MKKVWVVLCFYFDDTSIESIFDSEDKAKIELNRLENLKLNYHFYSIEEYKVR